ncbi:hypothetical protein F4819DRAFT_15944 [Hypoxylon fuscum]|nr:hypothetical protein F4819DRAFT_15944 [Hypoxylon fuscum]
MSPALASQCRRAAHRHLCPQPDSVWIPESLLAIAFERYCVSSRVIARHGSSVPGPMENRRRMGRRHMGELNLGQPHSAAPLWALENMPDLTQWQWKPPSPNPPLEQPKADNAHNSSLTQALLNWLAGPSPGPGPGPANEPANVTEFDLAPCVQLNGVGEADGADETLPLEVAERPLPKLIWDAQSTSSEVIDAGQKSLFRDMSSWPASETWPNFAAFCNSWKHCLANGSFSSQAICAVLDGVQRGLNMPRSDDRWGLTPVVISKIKLNLLQATIAGMSGRKLHQHNHSDHLVWDDILHDISDLQINNIPILAEAMTHIPDRYLGDTSTGILANLQTYLTALKSDSDRSTPIRQANKMANILNKLDPAKSLHILEGGTRYVLTFKDSKGSGYSRMRIGWLRLLARLPGVSEVYLAKTCSVLEASKWAKPLLNKEICELFLAKHRSSIKEITTMYNTLRGPRRMGESDSTRYSFLSMALWRTEQFDHVKGLCEFLSNTGREQDVMHLAKGFRNLVKNEATPLANLAIGAGQPLLAMDIFSLYQKGTDGPANSRRANFLKEALKLLIRSRSLRHHKIFNTLRLVRRLRRGRGPAVYTTKRQLLRVATAATSFAQSAGVSNRTSLTLISHCINYLKRDRNAVLPIAVLRALLHNTTRDLAQGKPGRTARLRWVLRLLSIHAGHGQMLRVGLSLRRWREANSRRHRENAG